MFNYIWPIALVVVCNTFYQIAAKGSPEDMNPFAALTITYLVGAIASGILYFALNRNGSLLKEYGKVNWAPFMLGIVIVGLEVGFMYAYRAGWPVSIASTVQSAFLAVTLIFVGAIAYGEAVTWNKIVGVVICLAGLALINLK